MEGLTQNEQYYKEFLDQLAQAGRDLDEDQEDIDRMLEECRLGWLMDGRVFFARHYGYDIASEPVYDDWYGGLFPEDELPPHDALTERQDIEVEGLRDVTVRRAMGMESVLKTEVEKRFMDKLVAYKGGSNK